MASKLLLFCCVALFCICVSAYEVAPDGRPIIMVHGFLGWGPEELLGYNYWGGFTNVIRDLKKKGYDTREAVVGPVSSNWDRALELYYFIKGGTVDYGEAHSDKYSHFRYGRTFPGLYPEWGEIDPATGQPRQIHIISHSMGAQTSRLLIHLLKHGSAAERSRSGAAVSDVFSGGKSWVKSMASVNGVHDGSSLVPVMGGLTQVVQDLVLAIVAVAGLAPEALLYDFKLDQFGLRRETGESFLDYMDKVLASSVWDPDFKDFCTFDLSPHGAMVLNEYVPAEPDVYYFSFVSRATSENIFGHHVHDPLMWFFLWSFANQMGRWTGFDGPVEITKEWWGNDGATNENGMDGPEIGSSDVIIDPIGSSVAPGTWNVVHYRDNWDHICVIGIGARNVYSYYDTIAELLTGLPESGTYELDMSQYSQLWDVDGNGVADVDVYDGAT